MLSGFAQKAKLPTFVKLGSETTQEFDDKPI